MDERKTRGTPEQILALRERANALLADLEEAWEAVDEDEAAPEISTVVSLRQAAHDLNCAFTSLQTAVEPPPPPPPPVRDVDDLLARLRDCAGDSLVIEYDQPKLFGGTKRVPLRVKGIYGSGGGRICVLALEQAR